MQVLQRLSVEHLGHVAVLLFLELHVFVDDGLPVDGVLEEGPVLSGGRRVGSPDPGARRRGGCGESGLKGIEFNLLSWVCSSAFLNARQSLIYNYILSSF